MNNKKTIHIMTLFPQYFDQFFSIGVVGKFFQNEENGFQYKIVSLSEYSPKSFKGVDAAPYGGGPGMIMRADVLEKALLEGVFQRNDLDFNQSEDRAKVKVICPYPRGEKWCYPVAKQFEQDYLSHQSVEHIVFVCGRYEGIDERFLSTYVDEFYSVGDFILTGGEIPTMAMLDSSLRLMSSVLGNENSLETESFTQGTIEHPWYTRPRLACGKEVPEVLLSGNDRKILKYRLKETKI